MYEWKWLHYKGILGFEGIVSWYSTVTSPRVSREGDIPTCPPQVCLFLAFSCQTLILSLFQALNQQQARSPPRTFTGQPFRKQSILLQRSHQIHTESPSHWSDNDRYVPKIKISAQHRAHSVTSPAQRWSQLSRNVDIFRETEDGGF